MNCVDEFIHLVESGKDDSDYKLYCLIQDEGLGKLVRGYHRAGYEVEDWMLVELVDLNDVGTIEYLSYEMTFSGEALYRSFDNYNFSIFKIITGSHYRCEDKFREYILVDSIRVNRQGKFSKYLNCLANSGFDFNYVMHNGAAPLLYYIQTPVSEADFDLLLRKGTDPFITIYTDGFRKGIPLIIYCALFFKEQEQVNLIEKVVGSVDKWNWTDEWGRNALHISAQYGCAGRGLLKKMGVDLDHRAEVDDLSKVVAGKMKGELPWGYGKTPKELMPGADWV